MIYRYNTIAFLYILSIFILSFEYCQGVNLISGFYWGGKSKTYADVNGICAISAYITLREINSSLNVTLATAQLETNGSMVSFTMVPDSYDPTNIAIFILNLQIGAKAGTTTPIQIRLIDSNGVPSSSPSVLSGHSCEPLPDLVNVVRSTKYSLDGYSMLIQFQLANTNFESWTYTLPEYTCSTISIYQCDLTPKMDIQNTYISEVHLAVPPSSTTPNYYSRIPITYTIEVQGKIYTIIFDLDPLFTPTANNSITWDFKNKPSANFTMIPGTNSVTSPFLLIVNNGSQIPPFYMKEIGDQTTYSPLQPTLGNSNSMFYTKLSTMGYNSTFELYELRSQPIYRGTSGQIEIYNISPNPTFDNPTTSVYTSTGTFTALYTTTFTPLDDFWPIEIQNTDFFTEMLPYPYGYKKDYDKKPSYVYSTAGDSFLRDYQINFVYRGYSRYWNYVITMPLTDTVAPVMTIIKNYNSMLGNYYYYLITFYDQGGSGLKRVNINSITFYMDNLVEGTIIDGTIMCKFDYTMLDAKVPTILLTDYSGNTRTYSLPIMDSSSWPIPPLLLTPFAQITPWSFKYIKFIPSEIDVSNGPVVVSVIFDIGVIPGQSNASPYFTIASSYSSEWQVKYYPVWDSTNYVYRCDITIPPRYPNGTLSYSIQLVSSSDIMSIFGPTGDHVLKIQSNYTDQMAPLITSVIPSPNLVADPGNSYSVNYTISISDSPNGLQSGYIVFQSNQSGDPIRFDFSDANKISGDIYNSTYYFEVISISGSLCVEQTFFIKEIVLLDNAGIKSKYPTYSDDPDYYDPFMFTPYFNMVNTLNVNVKCTSPATALFSPTIQALAIYPSGPIDVGTTNRDLRFEVTIGHNNQLGKFPSLYLGSINYPTIRVDFPAGQVINPSVTKLYSDTVTLPFGYGVTGIYISIWGVIDTNMNIRGFSTEDISMALNQNYSIPILFTHEEPIITGAESILYPGSGVVTLSGYGFTTLITPSVDIGDGNGFVNTTLISTLYRIIVISVPFVPTDHVKVKLYRNNGFVSKEFEIPVVPYFANLNSVQPSPISCLNNCTSLSNGVCKFDGCECIAPYSGPDCSTETIEPVKVPVVEESAPTVKVFIPPSNTTTITTENTMSIRSIREIGINGDVIYEYPILKWSFYNQSDLVSNNNNTQYLYSTIFQSKSSPYSLNTTINVTLQYFQQPTTLDFAGSNIVLPPFTIKYTIELSSYSFKSNLNTLQIVMEIESSTNDDSECSSQQYGLGNGNRNDMQWMKLMIDGKGLYGQFIRRGLVDNRVVTVTNSIISTESSSSNTKSLIGINIPLFVNSAIVDPSFSNLLDVDGSSDSSSQVCKGSDSKSGLTKAQLIGIIVGCAVVLVAIIIATIILIKRKYSIITYKGSIKMIKIR